MSRRVTYIPEKQRDGLSKRERARLKAIKPVVQAAMDQAALDQTLATGQKLVEFERQQDSELLASARAAFPELRRQARGGESPVSRPVASAQRASWPADQSGLLTGPAPFPDGLNVG